MKYKAAFVSLVIFTNTCFAGEVKVPFYGRRGSVMKFGLFHIPVVPIKGVMQIKVGRIANDMSRLPSQALSAALKANPKSQKFRLSWNVISLHLIYKSTVLYDRNAKTIHYFHSGEGGEGDEYAKFYNQSSLTEVTDRMIHQLATSNKGETRASGPLDTETAGFTAYITRYGAKIISSKSVNWTPTH